MATPSTTVSSSDGDTAMMDVNEPSQQQQHAPMMMVVAASSQQHQQHDQLTNDKIAATIANGERERVEDKKESKDSPNDIIVGGFRVRDRTLRPFYLHQWLDICDSESKWLEAQVITVFNGEDKMRVHYKGWKDKYDENLSTLADHSDASRIARLYDKQAERPDRIGNISIALDTHLDIADTVGKWIRGVIVEQDLEHAMVKVRYFGWSSKFDEWINMESPRLAPLHTKTIKPVIEPPQLRRQVSGTKATHGQEAKWRDMLLHQRGWIIEEQSSDGNCLFRSVAHQVYGNPDCHHIVRQRCLQYIISERYYFKQFISESFEQYVERLQRDGEWGDHIEIQAMSEIYDRPIEIYAYGVSPLRTFKGPHNHDKPIRLSYHFASHYNSIIDERTHARSVVTSAPGVLEEEHLRRSRLGGGRGLNRFAHSEGADDRELRLALEISRGTFTPGIGGAGAAAAGGVSDIDKAIEASLKTMDDVHTSRLAAAETASRREFEQQKQMDDILRLSAEQFEDEQRRQQGLAPLVRVRHDQKSNNNNNTSNIAVPSGGSRDSDLDRAIAESLRASSDSKVGTPVVSDGKRADSSSPVPAKTAVTTTTATAPSSTTTPPPSSNGTPSAKIENVIRQLAEFGFDRAACLRALEKLGYLAADNFSEDIILQSVIGYLMR